MNSDNETRSEPPRGIAAYRGNGVNISMMCGRCEKPHPQLGSKRLVWRGAKRAICKQCAEEIKR